jgi:ABC-2 type transport system permease protein
MKNIIVICKKELTSYFYSPIAYVVLTIFLLVSGYFFFMLVQGYALDSQAVMSNPYDPYVAQFLAQFPLNATERVFNPLFGTLSIIMLFMVPLLTMRLLAEEKKSGTFELLLTYPLRDIDTVLGKFLACVLLYALMLATTLIFPLFLASIGSNSFGTGGSIIEIGPLLSGYLGMLLAGSASIAFGLLASSLASNQIVAAVTAFGALLLLWLMGGADAGPGLTEILREISILEHFQSFAKGTVQSHDVIYYLNFIVFCLFLTLRSLESNKWRG